MCAGYASHLRLVKEGEVNRPTRTGNNQTPNTKQNPTPQHQNTNKSNQARQGSLLERLREPGIGETDICQGAK